MADAPAELWLACCGECAPGAHHWTDVFHGDEAETPARKWAATYRHPPPERYIHESTLAERDRRIEEQAGLIEWLSELVESHGHGKGDGLDCPLCSWLMQYRAELKRPDQHGLPALAASAKEPQAAQ